MSRDSFVRVLISLQEIVSDGSRKDPAPDELASLCKAMLVDQEHCTGIFFEDDLELLGIASIENDNVAAVVGSFLDLKLPAAAAS